MGKDQDLIEAARNGDIAVVEKILHQRAKRSGPLASLRRGPGANAQDASGFSALHHAAVNRHRDIVELLLSHEASTNIVDLQGSSPLHLAAWSGNEEIVRLLLTHGPSVPNVNLMNSSLETALHMAAQYGHVEVVRLLLHHGADPVITNAKQETSLDLAAQYGRLETVQLLLKSHPELIAAYSSPIPSRHQHLFPHTPLHLASRNGHRGVVEQLVRAGFDVNARTSQGTALHEAALCGKVDVVKTLLDASIDVCVADSQRRTAVDRLNEVGLKTLVAKEIAELIRGALKKSHMQSGKANSPLCSPHESVPNIKDGKLPLSQIYDNHSHSDVESSKVRNSYTSRHSPKANSFNRGKTRRSMDVYLSKGPDYEKPAPPKKPPRRNLSASPTHPGLPDFGSDNYDLLMFAHIGRNKSLDESVYGNSWRKSVTCFETSQSTDSIDMAPLDHHKCSAKSDIAFLNGLVVEELKNKSKSQHMGLDSKYVSVAHIKLRDAKSEQNVCPPELRLSTNNQTKNGENNIPSRVSSNFSPNVADCHDSIRNNKDTEGSEDDDGQQIKRTLPKGPKPTIAPKPVIAPKPKNMKRQGHSCDNVLDDNNKKSLNPNKAKPTHKSTSMSILSPVDVDKEWESIANFMDSLSVRMAETEASEGLAKRSEELSAVGKWLRSIDMADYEHLLLTNGFDELEFMGEGILDENSLLEIGILNAQHRKIVARTASKLEVSWPRAIGVDGIPVSIQKWLQELHLDQYCETFLKNLYIDPERLLRLWNEELITVLEIECVGHRRRILCASAKSSGSTRPPLSPQFKSKMAIDETPSDGSLPFREPYDLVSGVSSALKTAWRHAPKTLIDGSVTYKAIYVGCSPVQEFTTTEAIQEAIQEIRTQEKAYDAKTINSTNLFNINVTLIVSATVVSCYNAKTKSLVKEHDIGSIQCTCQASDDLRHLALVTRNGEKSHSCHVFCLDSVEIATEAILTLGQAFEVAYQLAVASRTQNKDKGHMRSKSANQLSTKAPPGVSKSKREKFQQNVNCGNSHFRSQSVSDITPPVLAIPKSASNSPQIHPNHKDYRFARAESFSFSSHSSFSRAPIVSKEEL